MLTHIKIKIIYTYLHNHFLIYVNNNNINLYQTTNNLYRLTLSGYIKYINNFITVLSGNLYLNKLTNYLSEEAAGYYFLKSDAAITYTTISNMIIFLTIGNASITYKQ